MLRINRSQPGESGSSTFMKAIVSLTGDNGEPLEDFPEIWFDMMTYQKISKLNSNEKSGFIEDDGVDLSDSGGEKIILPINLFFEKLNRKDEEEIYGLYKYAKEKISMIDSANKRDVQKLLQDRIFKVARKLSLPARMIEFCSSPLFEYPNLSEVGKAPHHTPEMTFFENDYVEITAISILCKMMVPIWGDFVKQLGIMGINPVQRELLSLDLIKPVLEEGPFSRIFNRLCFKLSTMVRDVKRNTDKNTIGGAPVSFILTHTGLDDELFEATVMATIIVKGMATYECMSRVKEDKEPNAMVYIDDRIKKTARTRIQTLRGATRTMPRREQPSHGDDDNSSILDHASTNSKKPIDVAETVKTAAEFFEIDRLITRTDTDPELVKKISDFYATNPFDNSPLRDAIMAVFVGDTFGGSKCIKYLPFGLYSKLVAILQIFLVKRGFSDLACLISAKCAETKADGFSTMRSRIEAVLKTQEYLLCQSIFRQYLEKLHTQYGKSAQQKRNVEVEKIDFTNHISRMIDWLVDNRHIDNTAPALWTLTDIETPPIIGTECVFSESITTDLCRFYLLFHENGKPF